MKPIKFIGIHQLNSIGAGEIKVIGKVPKYRPYVSISDQHGNIVVSLGKKEMNRLIKRWNAAHEVEK